MFAVENVIGTVYYCTACQWCMSTLNSSIVSYRIVCPLLFLQIKNKRF